MFDLHCHMLYGVDDGASVLQESTEMAKIAFENGTKTAVLTPHADLHNKEHLPTPEKLRERLAVLKKSAEQLNIPINFLLGEEILCHGDFIGGLKSGDLLTLNGSDYPLVEFNFSEKFESVNRKIESLICEGFVPVIAHPERYGFVSEDFNSLVKLKKLGSVIQINKGSLKGHFGKTAHYLASKMLREGLADVVASDSHSPFVRSPSLSDAHEYIAERYSVGYADLLLSENPKKISENKKII